MGREKTDPEKRWVRGGGGTDVVPTVGVEAEGKSGRMVWGPEKEADGLQSGTTLRGWDEEEEFGGEDPRFFDPLGS